MNNKELLTSKGDGLRIFDNGVSVCYDYPKWKNVKQDKEGNSYVTFRSYTSEFEGTSGSAWIPQTITVNGTPDSVSEPQKDKIEVLLDNVASMSINDLNSYINKNGIMYYLSKNGNYQYSSNSLITIGSKDGAENEKKGFLSCILNCLKSKKSKEKFVFDVIEFFTKVKTTTKESTEDYANRISKYLAAINMATKNGQIALKEKLLRELVTNKYEAVLAAEGYYHVIKEEQIVDFIKKCEKGLSLDYIKNFARPMPLDVSEALEKANALEVFDNYVILHYDPENEAYLDTAKEEEKKRDPILFGVIAGSTKLYYITDWVDEYCDLTLEKFVDTLNITKEDLIEDEEKKAEAIAERDAKKEKKKEAQEKLKNKDRVPEKADEAPLAASKKKASVKKATKKPVKKAEVKKVKKPAAKKPVKKNKKQK